MSRFRALALAFAWSSLSASAFAEPASPGAEPASPDAEPSPAPLAEPALEDSNAAARQEARDRFNRGLTLFEEGDFRLALIEFERAYSLVPDYRVLYNIAQVNIELGRYAKARRALEEYVEKAGDALPESRVECVKEDLEMLAARTARLTVTSNVGGAEIFLNDIAVGTAPLGEPLLVDAGEHRVELRKPGYTSRAEHVKLAGGDEGSISIELFEEQERTVIVRDTVPIVREERPSWLWATWTATGVLAASAVVTGVLGITKANELDDEKALPQADGKKLEDLSRKADTLLLAADITGLAAIVAGGVSLYFTLTPKKVTTETPKNTSFAPKLDVAGTPQNFRVALTSRF
jgi:tetratricopeptide (TPR) repeat protein